MKVAGIAVFSAALLLMAASGCGDNGSGTDVMGDVVALDSSLPDVAAGDTAGDMAAPDAGSDTTVADVAPDVPVEDVATDITLTDTAEVDVGPQDECRTKFDCDGCNFCMEQDGVMKCAMPLKIEAPDCYSDDECADDGVCHYMIFGKPECGGYCGDSAVYTLHEWGVNTVTIGGDADVSAVPVRYYDTMDRKPVVYIYSDEQFTLDLGIEYNTGTTVETWPVIPASPHVIWEGLQVGTSDCTTTASPGIDWTGETPVQEVWDLPNWVVEGANCLTFGETVSKLLFYAGPFTEYIPGVEATLTRTDTLFGEVTLTNNMAGKIGPVIVVYREAESACEYFGSCPVHTALIGWKLIGDVAPGATVVEPLAWDYLHVDATEGDPYPSVDGMLPDGWTEMPADLRVMLTDKGLTEDEADRFMNAWTDTMFGLHGADADPLYPEYREGAAVIYLWPDSRTDEKLPLTAVPAPAATVRAMVEYQQIETVMLLDD